ncbi:phosphoesterase [Thalassotalea sp. PLHSN55]|uniref:phosphoesterase n=1 Tax=Thalassotalea sp. PLHSN55 TaxID=3435888 RepID=UPI003F85ABF7
MLFKNNAITLSLSLVFLTGCADLFSHSDSHKHSEQDVANVELNKAQWLAGDHHIHSRHSVKWDKSVKPPAPILGGDAHYSTTTNAQMARKHGLSWMVTTDHGGPNHSKLNLESAYPDLLQSRETVPEIIQFYGMELDTPGAEHSSLIIPHSHDEADHLYHLEKNYAKNDAFPKDKKRSSEAHMIRALEAMKQLDKQPIVIVNHPSRTAKGLGNYGKVTPTELRNWNNTAPTVAIGMEGSPGHQAKTLNPDGSVKKDIQRGYRGYPTMGGFDQMTARLGGFWDSMLGEGRHWWVTSSSDSHVHYTQGRADFWPGEYSKTYIYAQKNYDDILANFRQGRIFVTTGDLISELYVTLQVNGKPQQAGIGDTLVIDKGDSVTIEVKFLDPELNNAGNENPSVNHVDIIHGNIFGRLNDKSVDTNTSTKVIARYYQQSYQQRYQQNYRPKKQQNKTYQLVSYTLNNVQQDSYIRVRGTNTDQLEPEVDSKGENPWSDLWFYSNPVFIKVKS